MFNHIKNYLDDFASKDEAFATKYDADKVQDCLDYIEEQIKETYIKKNGRKNGGCGISPDALYKMARDFFIDGKAEVDENKIVTFVEKTKIPEKKEPEETEEERKERLKREELERLEREQKRREKELYDREHKDGQTSIFDLMGV